VRARPLLAAMTLMLLVVAGTVAANITIAELTAPACACPSVNELVVEDLATLDALAREYAAGLGGLFPSYDEFIAMAPPGHGRDLTSQVDLATGSFTFVPGRDDARRVGYAVSADRRQYLLLGIGLTERYRDTYMFGHRLSHRRAGFDFPILRPGDPPPEASPPA
jgi:hypothetical protein